MARYGMHHDSRKVNRASYHNRNKLKTIPIEVTVSRSPVGTYTAHACVRSRTKVKGSRSWKAGHCGEPVGGTTPTQAAGRALETLGETLKRRK